MLTVPAGTAGGSTIWMRSPCGREPERSGVVSLTFCRENVPTVATRPIRKA